jgi:hypothetical protein
MSIHAGATHRRLDLLRIDPEHRREQLHHLDQRRVVRRVPRRPGIRAAPRRSARRDHHVAMLLPSARRFVCPSISKPLPVSPCNSRISPQPAPVVHASGTRASTRRPLHVNVWSPAETSVMQPLGTPGAPSGPPASSCGGEAAPPPQATIASATKPIRIPGGYTLAAISSRSSRRATIRWRTATATARRCCTVPASTSSASPASPSAPRLTDQPRSSVRSLCIGYATTAAVAEIP